MTIKKYYLRYDSTNYELNRFEYSQEGNNSVDTTKIMLFRDYDSVLSIGDDISVGYLDGGDVFVAEFNGDIVSKAKDEELELSMESYGGRINRTELITLIYEGKSPEYIVEDLITDYTTLTYASSSTSGTTITRFVINSETAGEAIQRILKELDWQIRTDNDKNFYFEPKGDVSSSIILTVGDNSFMNDSWSENPNRLINDVTVIGDNAVFNTNKTTASAAASQTDFVVDYKIVGTVRVTVDGTEKVGGESGNVASYDYSVDKENKTVIFETGMTGGEAVIVYYNYEIPIKIKARNDASITTYGRFTKKVTDNNLKTMSQARSFAKKIINTYGEPIKTGELITNWGTSVNSGETIQVTDSFNEIDEEFVVVSKTKSYPGGTQQVKVGVEEIDLLNWNKSLDERVKNLESKQDNSDIVQRYENFVESLNVSQKQGRIKARTSEIGNSWIVGSSTNGLVGTNTATQGGGQQVVGSSGRVEAIISVVNPNNIMIERFNFTTYIDTGNTTATVNTTTELCSFTSAEILQSLDVAKRSATIVSATITLEDSTNLTAHLSADGGSNWETVTIGTIHTFTNVGSSLRYKLTASDTAETEWVQVSYS